MGRALHSMKLDVVRLANPMMAKESLDLIGWLIADLNNRGINGDIVEAGCNNGLTSIFISSLIANSERKLHCYDFFCPIPENCSTITTETGPTGLPTPDLSIFRKLFADYPSVPMPEIHQGSFEHTMPSELPRSISLALIDADYYSSTRWALSKILPRVILGGVVAIHD